MHPSSTGKKFISRVVGPVGAKYTGVGAGAATCSEADDWVPEDELLRNTLVVNNKLGEESPGSVTTSGIPSDSIAAFT